MGALDKKLDYLVSPFRAVLEVCCTLLCWFPSMLVSQDEQQKLYSNRVFNSLSWLKLSSRSCSSTQFARSNTFACICSACDNTFACICSACDSTFACICSACDSTFACCCTQMLGKVNLSQAKNASTSLFLCPQSRRDDECMVLAKEKMYM